jgi:hypothetical protein
MSVRHKIFMFTNRISSFINKNLITKLKNLKKKLNGSFVNVSPMGKIADTCLISACKGSFQWLLIQSSTWKSCRYMHLKEENFSILNKPQAVLDRCVSCLISTEWGNFWRLDLLYFSLDKLWFIWESKFQRINFSQSE